MTPHLSQTTINTPWWKLLLVTIFSAFWTYALVYSIQHIRISNYTWAKPILQLSEHYNGQWQTPTNPYSATELFYKWDSYYYIDIARNGYNAIPFATDKRYNWAFFPIYPLLIGIFGSGLGVLQNTNALLIIGMLMSNVCFFAGLLVWKQLAQVLGLTRTQWKVFLASLVFFPLSYIFHFVYTESLFFLLTSGALYFLAKQRYLPAAWLIGLSAATRITGLVLVPFLLLSYLRNTERSWKSVVALSQLMGLGIITITPVVAFFNYLALLTGELFAPLKIQAAWNNENSLPFSTFIGYIKDYGLSFHPDHGVSIILLVLSWSLVLWSGYTLWRNKQRTELHVLLWALTVVLVLVNSSINNRSSIFRYTITIPYLFVIFSKWLSGQKLNKLLGTTVVILATTAQILFLTFFLWLIPLYGF